jgi:hypothetical protein
LPDGMSKIRLIFFIRRQELTVWHFYTPFNKRGG